MPPAQTPSRLQSPRPVGWLQSTPIPNWKRKALSNRPIQRQYGSFQTQHRSTRRRVFLFKKASVRSIHGHNHPTLFKYVPPAEISLDKVRQIYESFESQQAYASLKSFQRGNGKRSIIRLKKSNPRRPSFYEGIFSERRYFHSVLGDDIPRPKTPRRVHTTPTRVLVDTVPNFKVTQDCARPMPPYYRGPPRSQLVSPNQGLSLQNRRRHSESGHIVPRKPLSAPIPSEEVSSLNVRKTRQHRERTPEIPERSQARCATASSSIGIKLRRPPSVLQSDCISIHSMPVVSSTHGKRYSLVVEDSMRRNSVSGYDVGSQYPIVPTIAPKMRSQSGNVDSEVKLRRKPIRRKPVGSGLHGGWRSMSKTDSSGSSKYSNEMSVASEDTTTGNSNETDLVEKAEMNKIELESIDGPVKHHFDNQGLEKRSSLSNISVDESNDTNNLTAENSNSSQNSATTLDKNIGKAIEPVFADKNVTWETNSALYQVPFALISTASLLDVFSIEKKSFVQRAFSSHSNMSNSSFVTALSSPDASDHEEEEEEEIKPVSQVIIEMPLKSENEKILELPPIINDGTQRDSMASMISDNSTIPSDSEAQSPELRQVSEFYDRFHDAMESATSLRDKQVGEHYQEGECTLLINSLY